MTGRLKLEFSWRSRALEFSAFRNKENHTWVLGAKWRTSHYWIVILFPCQSQLELETFGKSLSLEIATDSHTSLACQNFSIRDHVKEHQSWSCPLPRWMSVQHLPSLSVMINLVKDGKLYTWSLCYLQTRACAIWLRFTLYQPELSLLYSRGHWGTENLSHFPSHTVKTHPRLDQNSDSGGLWLLCSFDCHSLPETSATVPNSTAKLGF